MGHPGLSLVYFHLFKKTLQFFTKNTCEKCPSSLRCWDLNPQPSEHESPLITIRTRLPRHFHFSLSLFHFSLSLSNTLISAMVITFKEFAMLDLQDTNQSRVFLKLAKIKQDTKMDWFEGSDWEEEKSVRRKIRSRHHFQ